MSRVAVDLLNRDVALARSWHLYTLLLSGDAAMTTNVTLYPKLGYRALRDLECAIHVHQPSGARGHDSLVLSAKQSA